MRSRGGGERWRWWEMEVVGGGGGGRWRWSVEAEGVGRGAGAARVGGQRVAERGGALRAQLVEAEVEPPLAGGGRGEISRRFSGDERRSSRDRDEVGRDRGEVERRASVALRPGTRASASALPARDPSRLPWRLRAVTAVLVSSSEARI